MTTKQAVKIVKELLETNGCRQDTMLGVLNHVRVAALRKLIDFANGPLYLAEPKHGDPATLIIYGQPDEKGTRPKLGEVSCLPATFGTFKARP